MGALRVGLCLRVLALVLLLALVPTGYLVYELQLKPWGRDQLKAAAANVADSVPAVNTNTNAAACTQCPGINAVFPVTSTTHPSYGSFQTTLINDGGWIASLVVALGVGLGGGGSLALALLSPGNGAASTTTATATQPKPTSSTAFNGCGVFEMVMLLSHAQFATMLGTLRLRGAPRFWDEFAKKLAWSNLLIFPPETHLEYASADASTQRRLQAQDGAGATGVERYALLVGVQPQHLFYYTCTVLAIVLAIILVTYLFLRLVLMACKRPSAATLDHRVIWVYLQLFLLAQYVVSLTACYQIYLQANRSRPATGDITLAIVLLALLCLGVLVFGVVKLARHRDELETHGTPEHDASKWFHLRYSVFYQDYNVPNLYFFVAKMVLDIASGAVVATVQDAMTQIGVLVGLNAVYLLLMIGRQPFLVPLFYFMSLVAGYLRIALLVITMVQAYPDVFPQDTRDFAGALVIAIHCALLMCIMLRQLFVLVVALIRWAKNRKSSSSDDSELGIPLQEMSDKPVDSSHEKADSQRTSRETAIGTFNSSIGPISNSTIGPQSPVPAAAPYQELQDDPQHDSLFAVQNERRRSSNGKPRRSLYSKKRRRNKPYEPVQEEDLPPWARV
ncbi:hypothetical protein P43SY_004828 [Pythium insidiosum]|uniref:TRP C-terminal domain-containing protein n=1 Tax=Pythium insidiosum TaxID=114742 RepID=A0AAD5QC42_PYTIN|nr:hypothetical protein P43SY_004828 [Pythium insidiosum]